MKVILVEGFVSIEFIDTGKKIQVDNEVISTKLSEAGLSMGTMLFLMRLPYIKTIGYSKKRKMVYYEFYVGTELYSKNKEYMHHVDESIIKVFDWCEANQK